MTTTKHGPDRGDGRDAHGRFVTGGEAPHECFWRALDAIQERQPNAVNGIGCHITTTFMWWVNNRKG